MSGNRDRVDKTIVKCFLLCVFGVIVGHSWMPRKVRVESSPFRRSADKMPEHIQKELIPSEIEVMKENWRSIFWVLDLDRDEMITEKDIDIFKNNFFRTYELHGTTESVKVASLLDSFMHCIVFQGLQSLEGVSESEFLRIYSEAYQLYRPAGVKRLHRCNGYLLSVIDRNSDGFLSFKELLADFKAWNQGNINYVQNMFQLMGPNEDNLVPVESFDNIYTELAMGRSNQQFEETNVSLGSEFRDQLKIMEVPKDVNPERKNINTLEQK